MREAAPVSPAVEEAASQRFTHSWWCGTGCSRDCSETRCLTARSRFAWIRMEPRCQVSISVSYLLRRCLRLGPLWSSGAAPMKPPQSARQAFLLT